jgi:hypothetical protein
MSFSFLLLVFYLLAFPDCAYVKRRRLVNTKQAACFNMTVKFTNGSERMLCWLQPFYVYLHAS